MLPFTNNVVIDIINAMKRLLFALAIFLIFTGCRTTANLNDDLSPAELIQRGQEAMDRNRYTAALQYYEALYERNRSNIDLVITAEYSIAFIHYKQGRNEQAREGLNAVLEYYNGPDQELLPQHFRILSNIVIKRIDEKDNQKSLFRRR